jgi:hypothetical protein
VFGQGQVVVVLQLGRQPRFERRTFETGTPGDRPWLYMSGLAAALKIKRLVVGIETEKVFATSTIRGIPRW